MNVNIQHNHPLILDAKYRFEAKKQDLFNPFTFIHYHYGFFDLIFLSIT